MVSITVSITAVLSVCQRMRSGSLVLWLLQNYTCDSIRSTCTWTHRLSYVLTYSLSYWLDPVPEVTYSRVPVTDLRPAYTKSWSVASLWSGDGSVHGYSVELVVIDWWRVRGPPTGAAGGFPSPGPAFPTVMPPPPPTPFSPSLISFSYGFCGRYTMFTLLSVLTLISVSVPSPCYRSST